MRGNSRGGVSTTPSYKQWRNMINRCHNPKNPSYHNYGGRGIHVCERWRDERWGFDSFRDDMGECPEGMTLDRMNNNRGYMKKNCRWATRLEQKANCRNNIQIHFGGETKCLEVWAREKDLDPRAVAYRHKRGVKLPHLFAPTDHGYVDWNAVQRFKKKNGMIKHHTKKEVAA